MIYMRKILFTLALSALALLSDAEYQIMAQDYVPTPVTISKDKVKVEGKLYYSHIVLEKQTLYSICKAYGVTAEDIYRANPGLTETGLKKNAIILVPVVEIQKESKPTVADEEQENANTASFQQHTDNAETKEMSVKERKKALKEQKRKEKEEKEEYIIHTVKWYEDLDTISEKYNVSVESIMKANNLKGRKLTNRQKLKIPAGLPNGDPDIQIEEPQPEDTTVSAVEEKKVEKTINENALFKDRHKDKIDIVMMMPFNASNTPHNEGSIDFYCGALIAAEEMGKSGTNIDLSAYDCAGGSLPITTERLQKSDLAIGPITTNDLSALLAKCPASTFVVSPLDHRAEKLASSYPNFIQVPAYSKSQYNDLLHWVNEERSSEEPVIVIYEKGYEATEDTGAFNELLSQSGIPHKKYSYSILEGRNVTPALESMMNKETANRVLIVSESEAFVNDVVRNLNLMIHNKYQIVLYAPSKIRSFETIEIDNLHNTNLHTSLSYYIDYDSPMVKNFIMKYRALYNTEPSPFAYQGYDICKYFIEMVSKYGSNWTEKMENKSEKMLQANYKFHKIAEGQGYINCAIRRVVYGPDYSVKLVN